MLDESRSRTSKITVIKRWMMSQCLHPTQVQKCRHLIENLSMTFNDLNMDTITMPDLINAGEVTVISNDSAVIKALNVPETPLNDILAEVSGIENAINLATMLNSSAEFDIEPSREQISISQLQNLFDCHRGSSNALEEDSSLFVTNNNRDIATHVNDIKYHMDVMKHAEGPVLSTAVSDFISRSKN